MISIFIDDRRENYLFQIENFNTYYDIFHYFNIFEIQKYRDVMIDLFLYLKDL